MYAAPDRLTTHRLVALDVPTPSWMRAPGECPGMFALESAMDELAIACGIDPIELRIANEPPEDPEKGIPFSSRNLVACLREGAERFGWAERDPTPGARRDGRWLVGTGVAASTYPVYRSPSKATARLDDDGDFTVQIAAADIGTGARTVLTQIAADALGVGPERVRMEIGDSDFGQAAHRRRLDGDGVVGLGRREGLHGAPGPGRGRGDRRHRRRGQGALRSSHATPSAPSSSRSASTSTAARSASRGCSASSASAASSTRRRRARSSSAA